MHTAQLTCPKFMIEKAPRSSGQARQKKDERQANARRSSFLAYCILLRKRPDL